MRVRAAKARSAFRPVGLLGGGTLLVGAAGYAFVALAGHTMSTSAAAAISSFYLLANILGPGMFVALEQETSRTTSRAIADHRDPRSGFRTALLHGIALVSFLAVVLAIFSPLLIRGAFAGHAELLPALALSALTAAMVYLVRGVLGGMRRFDGYSTTLGVEGLARLVLALALAAAGWAEPASFGGVYGLASGLAAVAGLRWLRRTVTATRDCAEPGTASTIGPFTLLVAACFLAQVVANLVPVLVTARLSADTATAAAFAAAFLLARIPLFVFSPVQALVVPTTTAAVVNGDTAAVRRIVGFALMAAGGAGVAWSLGMAVAGPWAVATFFGSKVALPGLLLALLAVSALLLIAAQVLQAALVAFHAHRAVVLSWTAGTIALSTLIALPVPALHAAVAAQLVGAVVVVVGMSAVLLRQCGSRGRAPEIHRLARTTEKVRFSGGIHDR